MPTAEDRQAALEAIAFGSDPDVKPADRLKALELLDEKSECWACARRAEHDAAREREEREDPEKGVRVAEMLLGLLGPRRFAEMVLRDLDGTAGAEPATEVLAAVVTRYADELHAPDQARA